MKNLMMWITLVTLVVTGCTNEKTQDEIMKPIQFRISQEKNTKAPFDGTTFPTSEDLGMFAYAKTGADYDYTKPYINDVNVFYSSGVWTSNPPLYWPLMGTLKFVSYAPYQASSGTYMSGGVSYSAVNGMMFNGFNVMFKLPTNIPFHYDLMYSDEVNDQAFATASLGVPLVFHHSLTQVVFAAVSMDVAYKVKKIELIGVVSKGDFKAKASPQWTVSTNPLDVVTYTCYEDAVGKTVPIDPLAPVVFDNRLLLIPQTLTVASIKVTFDATFNGTNYTNVTRTYPLAGATWRPNERIKYTFRFAANQVTFLPAISSWDTEVAGN